MTRAMLPTGWAIVVAGVIALGGVHRASADPVCGPPPASAAERAACKPILAQQLELATQDEARKMAAAEAARKHKDALPAGTTQAILNAAIKEVDDTRRAALQATENRKRAQTLVEQLAAAPPAVVSVPAIATVPAAAAIAVVPAGDLADQAYHQNHCERELVICYDRDGALFVGATARDHLPPALRSGDKVTVVVLTDDASDTTNTISVTFAARASLEHQFSAGATPVLSAAPPAPAQFIALPFPSEAIPDEAVDLTISFQRLVTVGAGVETTQVIPVELGYSYFSVALLVAATYKADRHVLRDLGTTSDHAVTPGLALNIFPGGRQRGLIGYLRHCGLGTWAHVGRCLANNLGFQIATDLDLSHPTDKLYVGLVFEPVAGLAIVGGVSLRKVDVVPPAGSLPALEGMVTAPSETRYVTRGYAGVTITLDLLDTISSVGGSIKKVKVP